MTPHEQPPTVRLGEAVRFTEAVRFWLKLGFISFGGPAGQIAVLHQELVEKRRWISESRFLHALHYCMLLPGPEAQQLVTYMGWLMHKRWGGIVAGSLFVLPSLLLLIVLSWVYVTYGQVPMVVAVLAGIKPAVVAIVAHAVYRIGSRTLHHPGLWFMAGASFVAIFFGEVPFPWIVIGAALIGWVAHTRWPEVFQARGQGHHNASSASSEANASQVQGNPASDAHDAPAHTRFSLKGLLQVLVVGLALWALPLALAVVWWGWQNNWGEMGWFFTKAALLTFGGAYAVLPYVYQGAVQQFAWLSAGQMMDGLALGESTPGPLIMVVAFVGFLGGYQQAWLGAEHALASGVWAACWATWFTFLPSFVFILAGGPIVEHTHGQLRLTAPLTAITAAVVGVVLNLALFFAWQVWWPQGWAGSPDGLAVALTLVAGVALVKFKRGVIEVILGCALAGWLMHAVRSGPLIP